MKIRKTNLTVLAVSLLSLMLICAADDSNIGREVAVSRHLQDGEEFTLPLSKLLRYGKRLFAANFTIEEGAGRPQTKGTGARLSALGVRSVFRLCELENERYKLIREGIFYADDLPPKDRKVLEN